MQHAMQVRAYPWEEIRDCVQAWTLLATMLQNPRIGRVNAGCYADLLVLDADPLKDVTILDRPEKHLFAVIKGGRIISSKVDGLPVNIDAVL